MAGAKTSWGEENIFFLLFVHFGLNSADFRQEQATTVTQKGIPRDGKCMYIGQQ